MLQWMGGSRRNVTTSRKSTQKRQKQYFEQRKRQQQQHQADGPERSFDGTSTFSQQEGNNRSLDVVSLLNLSTVSQEFKSCGPRTREGLNGVAWAVNYGSTQSPPIIQTKKLPPVGPIEIKEANVNSETSTDCQMETGYPKRVLFSVPASLNKASTGNDDIMDHLKMASEHQLSVLDLLGDDGTNGNSGEISLYEDHVAFSVEGLGKVETETPVHSPQQSARAFSYGGFKPAKATRRSYPSNLHCGLNDLEPVMDAMLQDIDMSFYGSSLGLPCSSMGMMDSFGNTKHKLPFCKVFSHPKFNYSNFKSTYGDEDFYNSEDTYENIWNANSSFLDDSFLDMEEYSLSRKKRSFQLDSNPDDYFNIGSIEKPDYAFEHPYLQNKRATPKAAGRFSILDSPAPYSKHQISTSENDFLSTNTTWYPTVERRFDLRDVTNQPAWPCFVTEDPGESISLLSEESSSSSAVRGEATKNSPPNSAKRCDMKSLHAKERHCKRRLDLQQGENIYGPVKFTRLSNPSSSTPARHSTGTFQNKSSPGHSWLFEEKYTPDVGFSSFCQTLEAKRNTRSDCKFFTEDPFGAAYPGTKIDNDFKSSFETCKYDVPAEISSCSSVLPEKFAFPLQFSRVQSYMTTTFLNTTAVPSNPKLSPEFNMECRFQNSFHVIGCSGDAEFPKITVPESVSNDEAKTSEIPPSDIGKVDLQDDVCNSTNNLSFENGMDASDSINNCSHSEEPRDLTPEMMETFKVTCSPENAEETSSSVEGDP